MNCIYICECCKKLFTDTENAKAYLLGLNKIYVCSEVCAVEFENKLNAALAATKDLNTSEVKE